MPAAIFNGNFVKTLKDALRLGSRASDPSGAAAGDIYYSSADSALKIHNGTAFVGLGNGSITTAWRNDSTGFAVVGWDTISNLNITWRRVGDTLQVVGYCNITTGNATAVGITLPYTLDTTKISAISNSTKVGEAHRLAAAAIPASNSGPIPMYVDSGTTNKVFMTNGTPGASAYTTVTGTGTGWGSGNGFSFHFTVPISGWSAINTVSSAVQAMNVVTKTTTYTATTADDLILCSGSAFTVTLPAAATQPGKILTIKKTDSSLSNIITVDGNGSETIDSSTTYGLYTLNETIKIVSDGTNWQVLEHKCNTEWVNGGAIPITTTGSALTKPTTSTDVVWWRRVGESAEIRYEFRSTAAGSAGTGDYLFGFPSGLTIDSAKIKFNTTTGAGGSDPGSTVGTATVSFVGTSNASGNVRPYSTTAVRLHAGPGVNSYLPVGQANANANFSSTPLEYSAHFTVPIANWKP